MAVEIKQADINVLRTLEPRKSILNFSSAELAATQKWAEKFQGELSEKSPFYRLVNGDWRENDETRVPIIDVADKSPTFKSIQYEIKQQVIFRGEVQNIDTDWTIQVSRKGLGDTVYYASKYNDIFVLNALYNINDILTNAVMLDSTITDDNNPNKANNTAFMHKMYAVCKIDEDLNLAKIAVEEFANGKNDTLKRMYNMQSIKIEPLRNIAFTNKRLALSVLNSSNISISDLFQLVKSFDKDFYLNKRSEQQIEKNHTSETERNDNVAEISQQELLERIAALESQVKEMSAEQQNLKEQIETVNNFVSAITESQNFEQSMATIESMGKQVLDCGKAEFWCYDGAENKYFTNDENRGGRDWQIAKENMRIAAETKEAHIADGEAYIPIISNDKVAGILVASEKDGTFDKASLDKFSPNGQIANTIDLSLKKEFEHQGRITDELTRLKNRQGAKEYATNTMAHNVNDERDMCLIMCDIDHFKSINDTYGHDAGDTVLKNVAGILQSGTRQGADSAFRWGGEEMVCILNCDYDHAMDIAERLRQQIESTTHLVYNADKEPTNVSVTISMGVYQVKPDKKITQENAFSFFEEQLKFADELAYKAKETGRNKVVGESDIMYEKTAEKESYSIFCIENVNESTYFRADNPDINIFLQHLADYYFYPEFIEGCKYISEEEFAAFEQSEQNPPAFCAKMHSTYNELSIWDKDKIATVNLDEAFQSIKKNGTLNLEYQKIEKDSYSIFHIQSGGESEYFRDDNVDVNKFLQRLADCNGNYPDFLKDCTKISEEEFAGLEQSEKNPPAFCAELNLDTTDTIGFEKNKELTVWDNDKIATMNLDEAIQSIKENGTVNLVYQNFAENNDTVELTSEYLDSLEQLNNAYDDFSYHNSIFNDEHIAFVDNHGQLPYDLNSAENRALVSEYINIQLDSGNINDVQRNSLKTLQRAIREFEEPLFAQKVEEIAQWADEVIDKSKGRDEPDRNDPAR